MSLVKRAFRVKSTNIAVCLSVYLKLMFKMSAFSWDAKAIRQWLCRWHAVSLMTKLRSVSASTRLCPWLVTCKQLVNTFLHHTPHLIVNRVQIWTIWRPQIRTDESGCLSFKQRQCFMGMVHRCTVQSVLPATERMAVNIFCSSTLRQ